MAESTIIGGGGAKYDKFVMILILSLSYFYKLLEEYCLDGAFYMSKTISTISFKDNPALKGREDKFVALDVKVGPVLASWCESIFAHEWLDAEGKIKKLADMSEKMQEKRQSIESDIDENFVFERPVLGIGIMDNIEIGSGKDLFLCLAARGLTSLSVHIPKANEKDFRMFIR